MSVGFRTEAIALAVVMLFTVSAVQASGITVRVLDRAGRPVEQAVLIVEPEPGEGVRAPDVASELQDAAPAIVDQKDRQFVPYVTAIRTGTAVVFPNSDSIAHQVYSFSAAKRFELGLYRGRPHPPVRFDKPGIVVLGCNIHDWMIGYIYVTDALDFGTSNERGEWESGELAAGHYRVSLWSPRLAKDEEATSQAIAIESGRHETVTFRLQRPLRDVPGPRKEPRARDY